MRTAKDKLRKQVLAIRDALSFDTRESLSQGLTAHTGIFGHIEGAVIATFWPIKSEVDPSFLAQALKERGARLALPVVTDPTTLDFRAYDHDDDLIDAGFGTKGPSSTAPSVSPDIMLVPLAVFDAACGRIGYGAGFYDRAIAALRGRGKNPMTVGLAFGEQKVDHVPQDEYDIALDWVLTPVDAYRRDTSDKINQD